MGYGPCLECEYSRFKEGAKTGDCVRFPPQPSYNESIGFTLSEFPEVRRTWGCGEFAPRSVAPQRPPEGPSA